MVGWVAASNETKANSAQFQVKLPTRAELGNTNNKHRSESTVLETMQPGLPRAHLNSSTLGTNEG